MSQDDPKPVKVRVDYFMAEVFTVEMELTEEGLSAMVDHAFQFLKAGGQMPWDKWSLLSDASRTAFLMASEKVKNGYGSIPSSQS